MTISALSLLFLVTAQKNHELALSFLIMGIAKDLHTRLSIIFSPIF